MRHRVGQKRMGRPTDQRIAILKSLVAGVLEHGHVTTTEVRAKEARSVIEKVITLAREDSITNRRLARRWIPMGHVITTREKYVNVYGEEPAFRSGTKEDIAKRVAKAGDRGLTLKGSERRPSGERLLKMLFEEIGPRFKDRSGGYLRLTRLGGESHINTKGVLTIRAARRGDSAKLVKIELVD